MLKYLCSTKKLFTLISIVVYGNVESSIPIMAASVDKLTFILMTSEHITTDEVLKQATDAKRLKYQMSLLSL